MTPLELAYLQLIIQLLPEGLAWDDKYEDGTPFRQLLAAKARVYSKVEQRGWDLVREANPATTVELLPDFEEMLGLPDECMPPATSIDQRRNRVLGKNAETGGQSVEYMESVAAAYGYNIQIEEHPYFRADVSRADDAAPDLQQHLTFTVHYPNDPVYLFRADVGRADDHVEWYDTQTLQCVINRIKPAHTFAYYDFSQP